MSRRRRAVAVAVAILAGPFPAAASAQRGQELGVQAMALFREESFYGGGVSAGYRFGGRVRAMGAGLVGVSDDETTFRGELAGHLLASPLKRGGIGLYGLAGAGFEAGRHDQGFVIVGLGLDTDPGGKAGFHLEAGVGGGFRLSMGWRARFLNP